MRAGYSVSQKTLHWATVLMLVLQWWTSRAVLRTHEVHLIGHKIDPFDLTLHKLHIYGGVAVLGLVAYRVALRWRQGVPLLPLGIPRWMAGLAQAAHLAIYATLVGLVITGLVTTYFWFGMSIVHRVLVYWLYLLIAAHVLAVIWHDTVHRAGLFRRMTRQTFPALERQRSTD